MGADKGVPLLIGDFPPLVGVLLGDGDVEDFLYGETLGDLFESGLFLVGDALL